MQILYQDEYGEQLFLSESGQIPTIGDTVQLDEEDWRVRSRTFVPMQNAVIIELTQNLVRAKEEDGTGTRLKEMSRAIVETNKRQDVSDKKNRMLREQLVSVRQQIKQTTPKPKEST
jgi:septal ring factor EnvC (AmiA/AmiB activator)